jgi:RNA polymerase sigma factor (sigma-70 family)
MIDRTAVVTRFLADRSHRNRDAVVAAYGYLCRRGAHKFRRIESDPADLEQVAAIGLIKATDMYRAERTTPFEAYAWLMIVGELMHYVRDHERAIRVPRQLRSLERRYTTAWEALAARQHAEPSVRDLAREMCVDPDVVEELQTLRAQSHRYGDADLDARRPSLHCDALPARPAALSIEDRLTVRMAVEELSARERTVVLGTFAAGLSQAEIAVTLGLSQSQVSKILSRALGKLHRRVA